MNNDNNNGLDRSDILFVQYLPNIYKWRRVIFFGERGNQIFHQLMVPLRVIMTTLSSLKEDQKEHNEWLLPET